MFREGDVDSVSSVVLISPPKSENCPAPAVVCFFGAGFFSVSVVAFDVSDEPEIQVDAAGIG